MSHCSNEAIRSVTHLVLAHERGQFDLDLQFEPKGAGRDCSRSRLPPARFFWSPVFYSCGPLVGKSQSHWPRAQSRLTPGSRKPSVPGRVHSVPESCGSQAALGALPGSNPLLTHGTVESPTKRFLRRFLKNREPPPPISPVAPMSNTGPGWRRLSKISLSSLRDHLRRTAASNQSAGSNAQHLPWLTAVLIN